MICWAPGEIGIHMAVTFPCATHLNITAKQPPQTCQRARPLCKNHSGTAWWTQQRAQSIDLESKLPRSEVDQASNHVTGTSPIHGGHTLKPTGPKCCPARRHKIHLKGHVLIPQWVRAFLATRGGPSQY